MGGQQRTRQFAHDESGFTAAEAVLMACVLGGTCILAGRALTGGGASAAGRLDRELATGAPGAAPARPMLAWQIPVGAIQQAGTVRGAGPIAGPAGGFQAPGEIRQPGAIRDVSAIQPAAPVEGPAGTIQQPGRITGPRGTFQQPGAVTGPRGPLQQPGAVGRALAALQAPRGIQEPGAVRAPPPQMQAAYSRADAPQLDPLAQAQKSLDSINRFWRDKLLAEDGHLMPTLRLEFDPNQDACAYYPGTFTIRCNPLWIDETQDKAGAFAVAAVLAHEAGHFIQDILDSKYIYRKDYELDADAYAGAYVRWAVRHGLAPRNGLGQIARKWFELTDNDPRFGTEAHGNYQERFGAFLRGYRGDIGWGPLGPRDHRGHVLPVPR